MPWKRIAKIVGVIVGGGIIGSGSVPDVADVAVSISPALKDLINTIVAAFMAYLALSMRAPKDEK